LSPTSHEEFLDCHPICHFMSLPFTYLGQWHMDPLVKLKENIPHIVVIPPSMSLYLHLMVGHYKYIQVCTNDDLEPFQCNTSFVI
jgi:hypothetical protein